MKIDPMNRYMVTAQGDKIVIMRPPMRSMPRDEALALAAWIVALADMSDAHIDFHEALKAVEDT